MKTIQLAVLAGLFASFSFAASTTVNVAPMGTASGACSLTHSTPDLSSCVATFPTSYGTATASTYDISPTDWVAVLSVGRHLGSTSLNLRTTAEVKYDTEFTTVFGTGHGVKITHKIAPSNDSADVDVYVESFGTYNLVATLHGSDSYKAAYKGVPIRVMVRARRDAAVTGGEDFMGLADVEIAAY
jgi:hypothetical protein